MHIRGLAELLTRIVITGLRVNIRINENGNFQVSWCFKIVMFAFILDSILGLNNIKLILKYRLVIFMYGIWPSNKVRDTVPGNF